MFNIELSVNYESNIFLQHRFISYICNIVSNIYKMKNIITVVLIFISAISFAGVKSNILKGSFSGIVTDAATGKPLSGVSIYIADTRTGTTTGNNGVYFIDNIPEGNHLVEFSHIGFNTMAVQIIIKGETKKDISLAESVVENNAVVVTGVSRASQLKKEIGRAHV